MNVISDLIGRNNKSFAGFSESNPAVGEIKRKDLSKRGSETEGLEETVIQLMIYAMAESKGEISVTNFPFSRTKSVIIIYSLVVPTSHQRDTVSTYKLFG